MQCNGKPILWKHLEDLYIKDTSEGTGLRKLPKLKYEHLHLINFSKMRVDLAAQVHFFMSASNRFYTIMTMDV